MEQIMQIAEYVLHIGGALCVLLFLVILVMIIRLMYSLQSTIGGVQEQISSVQQSMMVPLGALGAWLMSEDSSDGGKKDEFD